MKPVEVTLWARRDGCGGIDFAKTKRDLLNWRVNWRVSYLCRSSLSRLGLEDDEGRILGMTSEEKPLRVRITIEPTNKCRRD